MLHSIFARFLFYSKAVCNMLTPVSSFIIIFFAKTLKQKLCFVCMQSDCHVLVQNTMYTYRDLRQKLNTYVEKSICLLIFLFLKDKFPNQVYLKLTKSLQQSINIIFIYTINFFKYFKFNLSLLK